MNDIDRSLYERTLRLDLSAFIHRTFLTLCPAELYLHNWHIDAIAWHLEQVAAGIIKRLIITLPPRSLKSICASIAFPAWLLGRRPDLSIVCTSYSAELASKAALDSRSIMNSLWYQRLFPRTRISRLRDQECDFMTTRRGGRFTTSVGGTLTGRGGNVIIIDDPLKPEDAMSDPRRTAVNEWFGRTLYSRLNDKRNDAIIVIMQRLHPDDLAGYLLAEQRESWVHLCLPAIAPLEQRVPIGPDEFHTWHAGEVLHAGRESVETLEQIRSAMGSYNFAAQYLQQPVPPEGEIIRWEWFQRYDDMPKKEKGDAIYQSWDTASKSSELNDFSVCTTWLQKGDREYYLLDTYRARLKYPDLRRAVVEQYRRYGAEGIIIESRGSGMSLIDDLYDEDLPDLPQIWDFEPDVDKVTRIVQVSAPIESGHVHLPREAPWLEDFRRELMLFPRGRHDDQVDSVSQFLNWAEYQRRHKPQVFWV